MSNKKKYYAVRKGTKCGIFSTWKDCQEAVQNYSGAEYKSFLSEEEARAYLRKLCKMLDSSQWPLET